MNDQLEPSPHIVVWLVFLVGLLTACSAPQSPQQEAEERVATAFEKASDNASEAELSTDTRWNPAACDAPEWQVMLWGQWVRAEIEGLDDSARVEGATSRRLRTTRSSVSDNQGWKYPVFEVIE